MIDLDLVSLVLDVKQVKCSSDHWHFSPRQSSRVLPLSCQWFLCWCIWLCSREIFRMCRKEWVEVSLLVGGINLLFIFLLQLSLSLAHVQEDYVTISSLVVAIMQWTWHVQPYKPWTLLSFFFDHLRLLEYLFLFFSIVAFHWNTYFSFIMFIYKLNLFTFLWHIKSEIRRITTWDKHEQ